MLASTLWATTGACLRAAAAVFAFGALITSPNAKMSEKVLWRSVRASREALARLEAYPWPGNIREMRNVLERACLLSDDGVIRPEHLPEYVLTASTERAGVVERYSPVGSSTSLSDKELTDFVKAFPGTRKALASHPGWSERTLYRRLKVLGLS